MAITLRSHGESPGANSTSCVIVKPAGLTLGDLMIAHIVARENTSTPVTLEGWTFIRSDIAGTATAGVISALYWKIAVQADVDATGFTFTITGATSNAGTITAWYGHDTTTPINANEGQGNAASTTITSDGLTPSVADCELLFFCAICDNNLINTLYAIVTDNPASWTERYDLPLNLTDDLGLSMAHAPRPQTTATGLGTTTQVASDANVGQLVVIAPSLAVTHYGAATLSGIGTLAGIGILIKTGLAVLTGSGLLSVIGCATYAVKATMSGIGAVSAIGQRIVTGLVTLAGIGSLACIGTTGAIHYGVAILSGVGDLIAKAVATFAGKATLSGAGNLATVGRGIFVGVATLSGIGTLATIGQRIANGIATLTGSGLLAVKGVGIFVSKATLAGVGSLSTLGGLLYQAMATLSGMGSLVVSGMLIVTRYGKATLIGIGTMAAIGKKKLTAPTGYDMKGYESSTPGGGDIWY